MPDVTDLPVALRNPIATLFQSNNYCFATTTGDRRPTFYFAQGGLGALNTAGKCGRLRTEHKKGQLIDITNAPKQHFFFESGPARDAAHVLVQKIADIAALNVFIAGHRQVPRDNDYHLEFTMAPTVDRPYRRLHKSAGRIVTRPRVPSNAKCLAIVNYVLSRQGKVRVDGGTVRQVPTFVPHAGPYNVAGFLEFLEA